MGKVHKAQVEFIVIVVLLIIGAVVILYNYQISTLKPVTPKVEQQIKNTINTFLKESIYYNLRIISSNGGFLRPKRESLRFKGKQVNYWSHNGEKTVPNIERNLVNGIEDYINRNKDYLVSLFKGRNITIGKASVSINMLDNMLRVKIDMPVSINDKIFQRLWNVDVETKLGEIIKLSKYLLVFEEKNKLFEYSTLISITQPIDDFETGLWYKFVTHCEYFHKEWEDIRPLMENVIKMTLAHIYMPDEYPLNIADKTRYLKYVGFEEKYPDLSISFHLPDGFKFDRNTFSFTPEPITVSSKRLKSGLCKPESSYITYNLTYPVIVVIKDPYTQNLFKFAFDVYIVENMPGEYLTFVTKETTHLEVCKSMDCRINISVVGIKPIEGAIISFRNCMLGKTNKNGIYTGYSPCGLGRLEVRKTGYKTFSEIKNANQLHNIVINMKKSIPINVFFYEVRMQNNNDSYFIPFSKRSISPVRGKDVILEIRDMEGNIILKRTFERQGELITIPEGEVVINAKLIENISDKLIIKSAVISNFEIKNDYKYLYIYLPRMEGFEFISDDGVDILMEKIPLALELSNALKECNIGPLSNKRLGLEKALVYYKNIGVCE